MFILVVFAYVQNVVLCAVAMLFYPGGTIANHDTVGYSFWSNTFSDMGRRVSLSGDPNTVSRSLWVTSQCILVVILFLFFFALPRLFPKAKSAKRMAIIGSIFGIIAEVALVVASCTPMDLHESIHTGLSYVYFLGFFVALVLYSAAIFRSESFPNTYAYVLLAYAIILVAGAFVAIIGVPNWETESGNMIISTWEKIAGYVETLCLIILAYGAWRVDRRLRDLGPESTLGEAQVAV